MAPSDVLVVGAGAVGCNIALQCAQQGLRTTLVERDEPAAGASGAAGGMLAAAVEARAPSPALTLGIESRRMHAELAAWLRQEHAVDVGHLRCGVLLVAFDEDEAAALDERADALEQAGVEVERLDAAETLRREPRLSDHALAALELPEEAQIEPRRWVRAVTIAAERAGVPVRTGAEVGGVVTDRDRVQGVTIDDELVEADHVVLAAGSWTCRIGGVPLVPHAVRPVRGQMIATETRRPACSRIVFGAGGYLISRADGSALCGSTEESAGFRHEPTLGGVAQVLGTATRLVPSLYGCPLREVWTGLRPSTPDGLPLVGESAVPGLWVASGHHRNGILLAPVTAKIVVDQLLGRQTLPEAEALDPRRFAGPGSEGRLP
jgi:glycine oxidase